MPRQATILRALVASPADLAEERAALEQLVSELNLILSDQLGVQLQLIHWETHTTPGLGEHPQDVINRQLPTDYDLFIGLMWSRFGTPTGRAGSGTEEEFNHALSRYRDNPASVDVMFYFKDAPIEPSRILPDQLASVQEFQKRLDAEGCLYRTFDSPEAFQSLLRIHLGKKLQEWRDRGALGPAVRTAPPEPAPQSAVADAVQAEITDLSEMGLLELVEIFLDAFSESTGILLRMSADLQTLTQRTGERTAEIKAIDGLANRHKIQQAKRVLKRTADNLEEYAARTASELPQFSSAIQAGIKAFAQAIVVTTDFGPDAVAQVHVALVHVNDLRQTITGTIASCSGLRAVVASVPRMTYDLIKAKRKAVEALDAVVKEFAAADYLLQEVSNTLGLWLADHQE